MAQRADAVGAANTPRTLEEQHRLQIETFRRAAAFLRLHLSEDHEAQRALATPHMRNDWDTWYFIMALSGIAARTLHELHGPEGADRFAEMLVQDSYAQESGISD